MKKEIHILWLFACVYLFCTCQSRVCTNIPEAINISADSLSLENNVYSPNRIIMVDDKAVVFESDAKKVFSVYRLPSFEYLYSFGEKGHGHNELLEIDNSFSVQKGGFRLFAYPDKIKKVTLNDNNAFIEDSYVINTNTIVNRFVFLENNEYVYLSNDDKHEYCLYNKKGEESFFGEYPNYLVPNKDGVPNMFVYNKHVSSKPDGKKFIAFYAYIRMCRIYDNFGNLEHETLLKHPDNVNDIFKNVEYPEPPCVTDENIYIIHKRGGNNELEVWNWEGELVSLYCLDKKLKAIIVSGNTLYGLGVDSPNVVYKYQL